MTTQNVILTGSLRGQISDPSGAVVPGASVVMRSLATGVERSATTNHAGIYQFAAVMPGAYSVTASLKGIRDVEILTEVLVGRTASQDIKLQVGANTDTVKVTGTKPLLRPGESSTSTVIDRSMIADLPLNGRNYTNLAMLTPTTSYDGDTGLVALPVNKVVKTADMPMEMALIILPSMEAIRRATTSMTLQAVAAFHISTARMPSRSFKSRWPRTPPSTAADPASSTR